MMHSFPYPEDKMTLCMFKPLVLTSSPVSADARHDHTALFGLRGNGSQTEEMLHM